MPRYARDALATGQDQIDRRPGRGEVPFARVARDTWLRDVDDTPLHRYRIHGSVTKRLSHRQMRRIDHILPNYTISQNEPCIDV